jgi:hypothetical protein
MMYSLLMTTAKGAMIVLFLTGFLTAGWANWRMTNRMRDSGFYKMRHPGFSNPKIIFAQWGTKEFPIFILAVLIMVGAGMIFKSLQ